LKRPENDDRPVHKVKTLKTLKTLQTEVDRLYVQLHEYVRLYHQPDKTTTQFLGREIERLEAKAVALEKEILIMELQQGG
jgi:hypothetical protein